MYRYNIIAACFIVALFSAPEICLAWVGIATKKIVLQLPETIEGRFIVQIYETSDINLSGRMADRLMVAGSEFQDSRPKGSDVEISTEFDQTLYLSDSPTERMSDQYFVRIIKSVGALYQYKDFRTWSFQLLDAGYLYLAGCRPVENAVWRPIRLSKEFTVYWQEENPGSNEDYSENAAVIRGLPGSFFSPLPLNKETGWRFKVAGLFYSEGGGERYYLEPVYRVNGKHQLRGSSQITIDILKERNFKFEESSFQGD